VARAAAPSLHLDEDERGPVERDQVDLADHLGVVHAGVARNDREAPRRQACGDELLGGATETLARKCHCPNVGATGARVARGSKRSRNTSLLLQPGGFEGLCAFWKCLNPCDLASAKPDRLPPTALHHGSASAWAAPLNHRDEHRVSGMMFSVASIVSCSKDATHDFSQRLAASPR
jgi:hypothetical protein